MKAIIPAAGKGSRFYPYTKCIPKEMLPIANKPIIHYVIKEAIDSGITDIAIITKKGKTVIEDYIDMIPDFINICYIRQKESLGLGDAILKGEKFIGDDYFAILLGDELFSTNSKLPHLKELIDLYNLIQANIISIHKIPKELISNYGMAEVDSKINTLSGDNLCEYYKLSGLKEKPKKEEITSTLSTTGRYILSPEIFKYLKAATPSIHNEIQLTDAINNLIYDGYESFGLEFKGKRWDVGNPEGYLEAVKSNFLL